MTAHADVTAREVRSRFKVRNLDIILLYFLFAGFLLLKMGFDIIIPFVFYGFMVIGIYTHAINLSYLQDKKSFLLDLADYDLNDIWYPLMIWGLLVFVMFGAIYWAVGVPIVFPDLDIIFFQMIIVAPSETIIFTVLLPEVLPEYFGRLPLVKWKGKRIGIPGWLWGAGLMFGSFHFWAYGGTLSFDTLIRTMIAGIFGIAFYALYKYGKKNKDVGGIMSTMSVHWNINIFALATANIIFFVL
jgi:hypothetical protein